MTTGYRKLLDASVPEEELDLPDSPISTPALRQEKAIQWWWTTEMDKSDIARRLGVTPDTVQTYLNSEPADEVKEAMRSKERQVRMVAVNELQRQLQEVGSTSRSAETPIKMYTDDDGDLVVEDVRNEDGVIVDRFAVPQGIEMGPDQATRYYRRQEAREILEMLLDITGGWEPVEIEVSGDVDVDASEVEDLL